MPLRRPSRSVAGRAVISWTAVVCSLVALAAFLPALGWYPIPYGDEAFMGWPAANYLRNGSFTYDDGPAAPHARLLWAYHAPLYPRAQILMFSAFGISLFSLRVLSYCAANLGHLLLTLFLLRRGYRWVAAACAVAWLGDRALMHVLPGRMEGLALLWGLCGFIALSAALASRPQPRRGWMTVAGLALGLAAVTHMITVLWLVGAVAVLLLEVEAGERRSWVLHLLSGWVAGACAGLLPLLPYPREAWEQFAWHLTLFGQEMTLADKWSLLHRNLGWAFPWVLTLILAVPGLVVYHLWAARRSGSAPASSSPDLQLARLATAFAASSLVVFLHRGLYEYYLVYFTTWATLAAVATIVALAGARRHTVLAASLAALLLASWLPSGLWNLLRLREAYALRTAMNARPFQEELRRRLSTEAAPPAVMGTPWLFPWALQAGIDFRPLPYHANWIPPGMSHWLLLTQSHFEELHAAGAMTDRDFHVVWKGDVYRGRYSVPYDVVLLAPGAGGQEGKRSLELRLPSSVPGRFPSPD